MKRRRQVSKKLARCMVGFSFMLIIVLSLGSLAVAEKKPLVKLDCWQVGDAHSPALEKVLDSFKADMLRKYNIELQYKWVSGENLDEMYVTAAIARKGYDVAWEFQGCTLAKRVKEGNFRPLDEYFPKEEYGGYAAYNDLQYDGKLYAMPFYVWPERVVYNKGLFRKAGLAPDPFPETWTKFVATCATLKAAGIDPLVYGNKGGLANEVIFNVWTPQAFNSTEDYVKRCVSKEGTWVQPELIRFLHMYKDLYDLGFFQKGGMSYGWEEVYQSALIGDKAAMGIYHGPSAYLALKEARGEDIAGMAMAPIWASGKQKDAVPAMCEVVGIAPWTKHLEEAVTVVKEFMSPEFQTKALLEANLLPSCPEVNINLIKDPYMKDLVSRLQKKSCMSNYALYSHAEWQAQIRYITLFLLGEITAEDALAAMDAAKEIE